MANSIQEISWTGKQKDYVDIINIENFHHMSLGRFGGNSRAGQYKNEDGCLIWADEKETFEFAVILDAHKSADSAELVILQFNRKKEEILDLLSLSVEVTMKKIEKTILNLFQEEEFLSACREVQGETACLIVLRKGKYLWWFSVGDCIAHLFNPELANLGQYQLNQRQFFEWVGEVNTFTQPIPCYSSGVRELRKGLNRILLTTDGLVECPGDPYSSPSDIYETLMSNPVEGGIRVLMEKIRDFNVRDSTTLISWDVMIEQEATQPSDI
ncbi:protein phosphatase 2C domain-containing protein [Bacillus salacetis]|uniref:Protein phosphatase 2C domain-containing protein n=1 Tax=Bacillus salacetis TaxID=2315464 RepID=A0A3A1QVI1_9BACI|nr:protein phosphatase 2C domain-containing protein [Bacillus salacetis]RIW32004.1 protein phosphatase 2C domain-containing protein [Bacillus salacetis]